MDFDKRSEITIETMGRVHNPTGEGVRAISSSVQSKVAKHKNGQTNGTHAPAATAATAAAPSQQPPKVIGLHETKVKEGTAKRNITRKKTSDKESGNYNSAYKKQGGHGKGQWKEVMDPSYADEIPLDENDPLYDEAEDLNRYVLTSGGEEALSQKQDKRGYDPGTSKAVYGPMLTLPEFKIQLAESIKEYFDSCDADEVIRSLEELGCQEYHAEIVKKTISLAMDKGPRERELTSRLLTCLHPHPLSMNDMETGFETLLNSLEDLCTDVPDANSIVASFLARAVVDEVLPPAWLSVMNNDRPGDAVIAKAISLLNREHSTARLEKVWGPGDGRPVAELKVDMDQLLQEYLLSRELDEAARCVKELDARHFHHELVKRGVFSAMEKDAAKKTEGGVVHLDAMAALFGFLVRNAIVSEFQVKKGIARLHNLVPDISLDVPKAAELLAAFEKMAAAEGCISSPPAASASAATEAAAATGTDGAEAAKTNSK